MVRTGAFLFFVALLLAIVYLGLAYFGTRPMANGIRRYITGLAGKHGQAGKGGEENHGKNG